MLLRKLYMIKKFSHPLENSHISLCPFTVKTIMQLNKQKIKYLSLCPKRNCSTKENKKSSQDLCECEGKELNFNSMKSTLLMLLESIGCYDGFS